MSTVNKRFITLMFHSHLFSNDGHESNSTSTIVRKARFPIFACLDKQFTPYKWVLVAHITIIGNIALFVVDFPQ